MKTILENKTTNMKSVFDFNTLQFTIFVNGVKDYTRKCKSIDELKNALRLDIERCEKRNFIFTLENK